MSWEFINPSTVYWDDWVLFFVQVSTLVFLMIYVWKTWEMATATRAAAEASSAAAIEAKEARMEALAPRMMVYFSPEQIHLAEVVVENIGAGTAANVKFAFEPPLQASGSSFDANRFFESVKPIIPPRFRMLHGVDTWTSYLRGNLPHRYDVRITYTGKENGREYDEVHVLDIDAIAHRMEFGKKGIEDLIKEVEKIPKILDDNLNKIDSHLGLANMLNLHHIDVRPLRDIISEISAYWSAAKTIDADKQARFRWEPALIEMRGMAQNALFAAARELVPECDRNAIIKVLVMMHMPAYSRSENYDEEMEQAISELAKICTPSVA